MKFLNLQHQFWQKVGKVGNFLLISVLWLIFSIPLLTTHTSTTALYSCARSIFQERDEHILPEFIKIYKKVLPFSMICEVSIVIIVLISFAELSFLQRKTGAISILLSVFLWMAIIIFFCLIQTSCWLLSKAENNFCKFFIDCVNFTVFHFPVVLLSLIICIIIDYVVVSEMIWGIIFLPGINGFVSVFLLSKAQGENFNEPD